MLGAPSRAELILWHQLLLAQPGVQVLLDVHGGLLENKPPN